MDCPPPPPEDAKVLADSPMVWVPVPTVEWLAERDLQAEQLTACLLEEQAKYTLTLADLEAARWVAADATQRLQVAEQDLRIARRRPTWPVVVGVAVVAAAGGVYAWEAVR